MPFVATTTRFPPPTAAVLNPNPLAALVVPLPSGHFERRQLESVLVTVGGNSIADDDAGIADCSCDTQDFEIALGEIAQRVEIVHLVAGIKKGVLGIVGGRRGTDDHAGRVHAGTGDAIRGGGVAAERSQSVTL